MLAVSSKASAVRKARGGARAIALVNLHNADWIVANHRNLTDGDIALYAESCGVPHLRQHYQQQLLHISSGPLVALRRE